MRARDNPFSVSRVLELRYKFHSQADQGWTSLLSRLEGLRYRAAIIGPHGSGKTTLLEDLGSRLVEQGFRTHPVFLNRQERAYPHDFVARTVGKLSSRDIVLLDGCEQLGLPDWWRFHWQMRHAGGLVVTTHRAGRLPVLWRCQTNPELLFELVRRLIDSHRFDNPVDNFDGNTPPEFPAVPTLTETHQLFQYHRGNLRDALRELYDRAAMAQ
ncbi:MAG: hypothetical protein WCJ09_06745 [Planctomycetota bacterium]